MELVIPKIKDLSLADKQMAECYLVSLSDGCIDNCEQCIYFNSNLKSYKQALETDVLQHIISMPIEPDDVLFYPYEME